METLPIKHINSKNNSLKLTIPLNKLIHKGYRFEVVVRTLKLVFIGTDISLLYIDTKKKLALQYVLFFFTIIDDTALNLRTYCV